MTDSDFIALLTLCGELAAWFPEGIVYIGGIAVYLHATSVAATEAFAETTHDADFYISLADMGDLRDLEEVTPNRRLNKHQLVKGGFEFDIYTERYSSLLVPYEQVHGAANDIDGIRIAGLEHLLVLKLEAFRDRMTSRKGDKDARDLLRIGAVAMRGGRPFRASLAAPYLDERHIALLEQAASGRHALSLARGNAVVAKQLRRDLSAVIELLRTAV